MFRISHRPIRLAVAVAALASVQALVELATGVRTSGMSPRAFLGIPLESYSGAFLCVVLAVEQIAHVTAPGKPRAGRWNRYLLVLLAIALVPFASLGMEEGIATWPWQYVTAAGFVVVATACAAFASHEGPRARPVSESGKPTTPVRRIVTWAGLLGAALFLAGGAVVLKSVGAHGFPRGDAYEAWFVAQPRHSPPIRVPAAAVVVIEFVDYQCPGCRAATRLFAAVFATLKSTYGDRIQFVYADFPLSRACNTKSNVPDLHPLACDAAVAVRVADAEGKGLQIRNWMFDHQEQLSRDAIRRAVETAVGHPVPAARWTKEAERLSDDIAAVQHLGIDQAPMYWVNGVMTPVVPPRDLKRVIVHELSASSR